MSAGVAFVRAASTTPAMSPDLKKKKVSSTSGGVRSPSTAPRPAAYRLTTSSPIPSARAAASGEK